MRTTVNTAVIAVLVLLCQGCQETASIGTATPTPAPTVKSDVSSTVNGSVVTVIPNEFCGDWFDASTGQMRFHTTARGMVHCNPAPDPTADGAPEAGLQINPLAKDSYRLIDQNGNQPVLVRTSFMGTHLLEAPIYYRLVSSDRIDSFYRDDKGQERESAHFIMR